MLDKSLHKYLRIPYRLYYTWVRRHRRGNITVVFLHGIGGSGQIWRHTTTELPEGINALAIDLLGFGRSPQPDWATYDAKTQARSVAWTLRTLGHMRPVVIVGHSLGSLVAVEVAKQYPYLVRSLVLCSPPFYMPQSEAKKVLPTPDDVLRQLYRTIQNNPKTFVKLSNLAIKSRLVDSTFLLTSDNVSTYMAALEAMIINQTSFDDACSLNVPIQVIRGTLDPFVLMKNLKKLQKANGHVRIRSIVAGHDVRGRFVPQITKAVTEAVQPRSK